MKPENLVFCGIRAYVEEEIEFLKATPEITIQDAKAGQYGIWVGRINMDDPVNGKLTASISQ